MSSKPALEEKYGTCYARKATSDVSENNGRTPLSLCGGDGGGGVLARYCENSDSIVCPNFWKREETGAY